MSWKSFFVAKQQSVLNIFMNLHVVCDSAILLVRTNVKQTKVSKHENVYSKEFASAVKKNAKH